MALQLVERRPMYDRVVDVPRSIAGLPRTGDQVDHALIEAMRVALSARYGEAFVAGHRLDQPVERDPA